MRPRLDLTSSDPRPRRRIPIGLRAGVIVGVALALLGAVVGTASGVTPFQNVVIANLPTDPIPVTGTVSVANLPATLPVSGTVDIGNLPESGGLLKVAMPIAQTEAIGTGSGLALPASTSTSVFGPTDVKEYRTVRLSLSLSTCNDNGTSTAVDLSADGILLLAENMTHCFQSWVLEVPGRTLSLAVYNGSGSAEAMDWELVGRP